MGIHPAKAELDTVLTYSEKRTQGKIVQGHVHAQQQQQ